MEIRFFKAGDFETYQSWFSDPDLNLAIGPLHDDWLEYVLEEEPPRQFSFFENGELIAVIGVEVPKPRESTWYITDMAVDPVRQREGIGNQALALLTKHMQDNETEFDSWIAFVEATNLPALEFFKRLGWQQSPTVDKDNFFEFSQGFKS